MSQVIPKGLVDQFGQENACDYAKYLMRVELGLLHQTLSHITVFYPSPILYCFNYHHTSFLACGEFRRFLDEFQEDCEANPDLEIHLQSRVSELEKKLTELEKKLTSRGHEMASRSKEPYKGVQKNPERHSRRFRGIQKKSRAPKFRTRLCSNQAGSLQS